MNKNKRTLKIGAAAMVAALGTVGMADEYSRTGSPEVFEKTYSAMHFLDKAYEIGVSRFVITADCADSEAKALDVVQDKTDQIEDMLKQAYSKWNLAIDTELSGFDLGGKIRTSLISPIEEKFLDAEKNFFHVNRCTGDKSATPVQGVKKVYAATREISVRMPNQGVVLNNLSSVVTAIEEMSEKGAAAAKVECSSRGGANYDLSVTEKTRKEALAEIKQVAKERAAAKRELDHNSGRYNNIWPVSELFQEGGASPLAQPYSVAKENGRWVAKFNDSRQFTVYMKQSSDASSEGGLLVDQKDYSVSVSATATEKLYGKLQVVVSKGCFAKKSDAETAVAAIGNDLLARLRTINGGQDSETDNMKVQDAFAQEYSPITTYRQYDSNTKRAVNYFYNPCTGEAFKETVAPVVQSYMGRQVLTITSSKLDDLTALKEDLDKKYLRNVEKADDLVVAAGVSFSAAVEVLDQVAGQLDRAATAAFLNGEQLKCDLSSAAFACISTPGNQPASHFKARALGAPAEMADAPGGYSLESARSDVNASERGLERIQGSYTYTDVMRKVIRNNLRSSR